MQFWSSWGEFLTMGLGFCILVTSINAFSPEYQDYNDILIKESHKLIKQGINETNSYKALDLLLKLRSDYIPEGFASILIPSSPIYYRLFALSVFGFFAAWFRPKTIIGIGNNKTRLKYYKHWFKLVILTLTGLAFAPWGKIIEWFWK